MTENTEDRIIQGILNVAAANQEQSYMDPNGDNPRCKPGVGTGICEYCGKPVKETKGRACPAVPPEQRWSIRFPEEES